MTDIMWQNDRELQEYGLSILSISGIWDGVRFTRESTQIPGRAGAIPHRLSVLNARIIEVVIELDAASLTGREAVLNSMDASMVGRTVELRFADQPNKVLECVYEGMESDAIIRNSFDSTNPELVRTIRYQMHQPVKLDRYARVVSFGSTRQAIELGTMPSSGVLKILGGATNPTVTYRASNGATVGQMGFTVSLASTEYLSIDLRLGKIDHISSGTVTNGADYLNTGDELFHIDPGDGDFDNSAWPTLEVDSGSGVYVYRKEYAS